MTAPTTAVHSGRRPRAGEDREPARLGAGAGLPGDGRVRDPAAGRVRRPHHRRAAPTRRRPAARRSCGATTRAAARRGRAAARRGVQIHLAGYLAMVVIVLDGVARRRADRGRLVLLAGLAHPRRWHRRPRPRAADPASRFGLPGASGFDQPRANRVARQRQSIAQAELGQGVRPVPVDRLGADPQRVRDLARRIALGDELEHLLLARGEDGVR